MPLRAYRLQYSGMMVKMTEITVMLDQNAASVGIGRCCHNIKGRMMSEANTSCTASTLSLSNGPVSRCPIRYSAYKDATPTDHDTSTNDPVANKTTLTSAMARLVFWIAESGSRRMKNAATVVSSGQTR